MISLKNNFESTACNDSEENIITEVIKLLHSYYEQIVQILNDRIIKLIQEYQNNTNLFYLNYLFKNILTIHLQRLETELYNKFEKLKNNLLEPSNDVYLLYEYGLYALRDFYDSQFQMINAKLQCIINRIENCVDCTYSSFYNQSIIYEKKSSDFLSDTEIEVHLKCNKNKENMLYIKQNKLTQTSTKIDRSCFSDSELDILDVVEKCFSENSFRQEKKIAFKSNFNYINENCLLNSIHYPDSTEFDNNFSVIHVNEQISKNRNYPSKRHIKLGMRVFALKDKFLHRWQPAVITRIFQNSLNKTSYCVKFQKDFEFETMNKKNEKIIEYDDDDDDDDVELTETSLAFSEPVDELYILPIRSRVVTLYQNENNPRAPYFSVGTICELPSSRNFNRYLVFFDDGYAQYIKKYEAFEVFDLFKLQENEINEDHLKFLMNYFEQYPEKPMVRLNKDMVLRTFYCNKWHTTKVIDVDCSLVKLYFEELNHSEWLYRGSYRLLPFFEKIIHNENERNRKLNKISIHFNRENFYNQISHQNDYFFFNDSKTEKSYKYLSPYASTLFPIIRKQTARKTFNLSAYQNLPANNYNSLTNNLCCQNGNLKTQQGQLKKVDLTSVIRCEYFKFKSHPCTQSCVSKWERSNIIDSKYVNPLLKPVAFGWHRQICTLSKESNSRMRKSVNYIAPCGRRLRSISEVDRFLYLTNSRLTIDMFSFDFCIHIDREFDANARFLNIEDITDGKENIPISCVNCVDFEKPASIDYSTYRIPLENVPLNIDENLMEGCNCEDGCRDHLNCTCWRKTFEATTFINHNHVNTSVGYRGRRLSDMVSTGLFECNSKCKCDKRCVNRVVQNGISVRLQLFKTANKGWGLRCLDDVTKGAFICIYTGHLMTEEQSDIRGKELGDEYFAELDFIECLKRLKEGCYTVSRSEGDSNPINLLNRIENEVKHKKDSTLVECIYLNSDDEEPKLISQSNCEINFNILSKKKKNNIARNNTLSMIDSNRFFTNPKNRFYFKDYLKNSTVYIMDAKICGNIGRYFNHSCSPNIFVQNVFVDTYDLRFPWIAFFASQYIRAGTELCWDYNYTIDSVKGRKLYCHCGSNVCRGRLL